MEWFLISGLLLMLSVLAIWVVMLRSERGRLESLLLTDELTGVLSRRGLLFSFSNLSAQKTDQTEIQVVFVDMNGLKALNSEGGHLAGDKALRTLGQRLREFCEPNEWVARYGGDEFVLFLRTSSGVTVDRLERLNESLDRSQQFTWAHAMLDRKGDLLKQINDLSRQVLNKKLDIDSQRIFDRLDF
ncbi:GGDEF domain-containing protein [Limnobacter parvus]|uniref:diguanylate cyclase n=1 Tax=Limnobacter parvus TaxID=2939690 RepID=A0ABT1XKQ3_9BURK|nr:GGDEF domain-containing protein [Limnobacter parvus]MCR2747883.1 GGDEF domain-containing protein [Limnobacter parvus]